MKTNKKFLFMGVAILSLILSGCNFKPGGTSSTTSSGNSSGSERAEYTITFDSQGGSPVASIKVKEGEAADEPAAPTKADNEFTGWYKEAGLYTLYDFNAPVFSDLTLYAGWSEVKYTVTFDSQGGSSVAPLTVKKGTIISKPADPIKSHNGFTGWYKEHELTNLFDFSTPITQNITLYAGWQESTYNTNLKIAVFADIQLCAKENEPGNNPTYFANAGNTVHAYVALKNHFKLCKEQNVDVILMNGDIVNNAIEEYYLLFKSAFESVYGTDSSQYPEIIYNMGNHEWWDGSEHETAEAVSMFKQFARIDTPNLVRQSSVKYYLDKSETLPTYYKVVNGVPFLAISGENSSGKIDTAMEAEIASWLQEISNLPSVQNGGPIYVLYHCALHTTLTHGNGAFNESLVLEELLASYPQAIVFTGDTHYSGVNERAINQVNFTCINIGSSSYSRMDKMSATMSGSEHFYNMKIKGGKTSDELLGDASYMHEYTPTIHIMNAYDDNDVSIDRYFSTSDAENPIHINKTWNIPHFRDRYYFEYTNKRFENTSAAKELYGANGVSWSDTANVRFGVKNGKMTVIIPDTNEYHYTEHYKIDVTGNSTKTYDVVNSYYLYHQEPQKMYFFLEDLPEGSNYSIKVTAYDYFDNPSLNQLSSSVNDPNICADEKDNQFTNTYYELSNHLNFEDHALDSDGKTSLEYYYSGVKRNEWGAPLGQLIRDVVPGKEDKTGGANISEYLSIGNTDHCEVILKAKIKNLMNTPIKVGYTLYGADFTYKNAQIQSTGKVVNANTGWNSLEWNITSLFPEIVGRESVTFLALIVSADGYGYNPEGYEMHLLLDDMDVVAGEYANIPETATRYNIEMAKFDNGQWRGNYSTGHMTFTETYGPTSTSAMKVTFENSHDLPTTATTTGEQQVKAGFDLAQSPITINKINNIDAKNCILSFDIKMSSEFFDSINNFKHRYSIKIEDETWANQFAYFDLTSADNFSYDKTDNGWIHVSTDLSTRLDKFGSLGDHTMVMTFGFFGIDQTTQQTAYIVLDNIAMTAK